MKKDMRSMEINFDKNCEPMFIHNEEEIEDDSESLCLPNLTNID